MLITVSRSGGFAGLTHTWSVQVEQQPDETSWMLLVDELPWNEVSSGAASDPTSRDRFVYRIRVNSHQVTMSESRLSGPWRDLVEKVRAADEPPAHLHRG